MRIESTGSTTRARTRTGTDVLKPRREISLDVWRGIAVLLMIITHAIAFFHIGENQITHVVGTFGGIASFTLFLFISGASSYFSYIKFDSARHRSRIADRRKKILFRAIVLLFGYYIVAIVAIMPTLSFPPTDQTWSNILQVITFQYVPAFTEFILAFIIFAVSLVPLRSFYKLLIRYPIFLLIIGGATYALGMLAWGLEVDSSLVPFKAIFVGHEDLHMFPIVQFSIVYLLGMLWGSFMFNRTNERIRRSTVIFAVLASAALVFAGSVSFQYLGFEWLDPLLRWPPSLTMMAIGLLAGYLIYLFLQVTKNLNFLGPVQVLLHYMGIRAFDFFIIHTIVLYTYALVTGEQRHESLLVVGILLALLIIATIVFTAVLENIITSLKENYEGESEFGWVFNEKIIVNVIWVSLAVTVGLTLFQGQVSAAELDPVDVSFKKRLIREEEWPFWWDHSFKTFRQISITNNSDLSSISEGTWYEIGFDHAAAVKAGKSKASGGDVRLVFYSDTEDLFVEIPYGFDGVNSAAAKLRFDLQEPILPNTTDDRYFLYYGNPELHKQTKSQEAPTGGSTENISLSSEITHKLNGSTNRTWYLKEGVSGLQLRTLLYTVQLSEELSPDSIVTYNVLNSDLRGVMDNIGEGKYQASVGINDLEPGIFQVQATAREPENQLKLISSGLTSFKITYPLYVVWTMDWEGWDVRDDWLVGMDVMAKKYDLPFTHFFNPHIFTEGNMDKARADVLTLWVQNRARDHNDEIGLHLHMWFTMVQAAGVQPRYSPTAPWLYSQGGGVLASAYTREEFKQILDWSKRKFQENGISAPISFRAGGWFAEEHTLQALADAGFLIESSGRTFPIDPRQVAFPPPWNLKHTTRPYQPNVNDINSEEAPHIPIWEFPNNGADSYWYSADELVATFDVNYPNKGEIMEKPQVLNYLSHPQFFRSWNKAGTDETKMTAVFEHAKGYLYRDDKGPVVYTTLENSYFGYTPWARDQVKIND